MTLPTSSTKALPLFSTFWHRPCKQLTSQPGHLSHAVQSMSNHHHLRTSSSDTSSLSHVQKSSCARQPLAISPLVGMHPSAVRPLAGMQPKSPSSEAPVCN